MRQILLLSSVKADLLEIQTYTHKMWGSTKVIELQDIIDNTLRSLTFSPFIGRKTNDNNIFSHVLGKLPFVIIYKVDEKYIRVIKVIHTKRNR